MPDTENQQPTEVSVDVLIIGGGIAGLWTLARMQQAGYKTVLLESEKLGTGQTRYAQGIIHGGTKYALTGKLTASSESVAEMPSRWRACYAGNGELDLTQAELISDSHYLWSTTSLTSRISGFFASKVMRSRSTAIEADSSQNVLPAIFQHKDFHGQFYRLDEPVFNTMSVIRALAEPRKDSILMVDLETMSPQDGAFIVRSKQGEDYRFHYKKIIFMAGQGNRSLLSLFGMKKPAMQLRPLKMVVMRDAPDCDSETRLKDRVYAHCLGASVNPRITITSHLDASGNIVWYMGGQLAEDGVKRSDEEQTRAAIDELSNLIPWLDLTQKQWGILDIDRAEIKRAGGMRPDTFSVETHDDVITTWPTKLALAPALADDLLAMLEAENIKPENGSSSSAQDLPDWGSPEYADFPWDENITWHKTGELV